MVLNKTVPVEYLRPGHQYQAPLQLRSSYYPGLHIPCTLREDARRPRQLTRVYLHAWQVTNAPTCTTTADEMLNGVKWEMAKVAGGLC
jgi:hypothetical protein